MENRRHTPFSTILARFLVVIMLMAAVLAVLPFLAPDMTPQVNAEAASELRQGDRLTISDGDWSQEYIVLNHEKTNTRKPGVFLLRNDYSDTTEFNYEDADLESANEWEGSKAQQWCTEYYRSMPDAVRNAVIGVKTVETESGFKWAGVNNIDGTRTGLDADKDKVFFLSYIEYDTYRESAGITPGDKWFLRSPYACGDLKVYVCVVTEDGSIHDFGTSWPAVLGARPAFNIEPSLADQCSVCRHGNEVNWVVDPEAAGTVSLTPSYEWSSDNKTCTGTVICSNCGREIRETVNVVASVTKKAKVTSPGKLRYTAAFSNEAFTTQTKTISTALKEVYSKKLPKVTLKAPKAAVKAAAVKWKKLSPKARNKISGIEICAARDKKFRKEPVLKTAKKSATSCKVKGLRSGKTYWMRVRTYKIKGNVLYVGKWSKPKKVKTR